jgi:anti-anti-sigma factor
VNGREQGTTLKSELKDGVLIFSIEGSIDARNTAELKEQIKSAFRSNPDIISVVIDFKKVDFMDSAGLGLVISALKSTREREGKMAVCRLKEEILMVFHLCKLDQVLSIHDDLEPALEEVNREQ